MNNSKAFIWGLLSRFAPQGLYLVTTMILARFLSPSDFGIMGVLAIVFMVANILLDSGLGGSLIQKKEIDNKDCSTISSFNILVSALIYLVLFFTADPLEHYFSIEGLSNVVKVVSIVFPITAFGIVPLSLLKRALNFKKIFISTFLGVIIASIVAIYIALNDGGVYALVSYQITVNVAIVISNFYFSKYKLSLKFYLANFKELIPFGFFTSMVTVIDTIYENLIITLTGKYLNVQKAGYLYQAKRMEETMSSSLSVAVGIVAFPILSRLRDDKEKFNLEATGIFKTITLLVFPLLSFVFVFSSEILSILFGKQWIPASPYMKVLMLCGFFILLDQLFLSFIKALGNVKNLMNFTIAKRSIGVVLLLLAIFINSEWLIYAYLLSSIIGFGANFFLYYKSSNINFLPFAKIILDAILPSTIFMATCSALQYYHASVLILFILSVVFFLFYYFFFLKRKGIDVIKFVVQRINK